MSVLTKSELTTNAQVIANETAQGANTATRIGGMFGDIIDSGVFTVKVPVSSAEILQLNSTPKELIAAPGAGKMIVPIAISIAFTWNSVAYTTNLTLRVRAGNLGTLASNAGILGLSGNAYSQQPFSGGVISNDITNTALMLDVQTGNPAAGNSTLNVYITYTVVTI